MTPTFRYIAASIAGVAALAFPLQVLGGVKPVAPGAASKEAALPKAAPRGDDAHVSTSTLPPFLGLFGSADLLAKVGFRSKVGTYIEFKLDSNDPMAATGKGIRFAQVGPADPSGARWIEMTGLGPGVEGTGLRLLTQGTGVGNIQRIIMQSSQMPAMEMPLNSMTSDMPVAAPGGAAGSSLMSDVKHVAHERVVVPLGTFETEHWMVSSAHGHLMEVWTTTDEKIPFTGAVKMKTDTGIALARKVGNDAPALIPVPPKSGGQ